ncbi:Flp family type IVb pilin [Asticcacaulis sp. ZE23SCel15]|uniref:Flp family type IVb pilin n=1 Tax=Asticcacaulis sp. ZE23SCel15 TaxID=3059027 RepID=UPI00265EB141|nr:Flp family type IVb pilin [Asticcacaulis sp. ZE23SCel15]WKL57909.1 Flp family type IVb pilin [Asticcacaulis sp. ZE23SCel15]
MIKFVKSFAKNESGATAIEYGLIAALIAVALITVLTSLGGKLEDTFKSVEDGLPTAAAPAAAG